MNVLGAGFITVDIIQLCKEEWLPLKDNIGYFSGGTSPNILSYLGRSGWDVTVLGGIGDDSLGEILKKDLASFDVNVSGIYTYKEVNTRRIAHLVMQDKEHYGMHRFDTFCTNCHREFPPFPQRKSMELFEHAKDFITKETILIIDRANELTLELAKSVSSKGGVVIFEPGYLSRNIDLVNELMKYIDLLKYSEELLWNSTPFSAIISSEYPRLKIIVETRGKKGVRLLKRNKELRLTTTPILQVEDSAGAGDAFMAGFLTGIGRGGLLHLEDVGYDILEKALERGQALGGLACRFIGSKGILQAKKMSVIEDAINYTVRTLQPPVEFSSSVIPKGMQIEETKGLCKVCHLQLNQ